MRKPKALGCHCFMGTFTAGVQRSFDVQAQMEVFDLGERTVEHNLRIPFMSGPFEAWRGVVDQFKGVDLVYGNPRCTGFSCLGHGHSEEAHGAFSSPTIDLRQLFELASWLKPALICAESVQQFGTTGRPLMEYLYEKHGAGYRVAEIYHNAAQFGNAQHRKRMYLVLYREDLQLPVYEITEQLLWRAPHVLVGDVIGAPGHSREVWNDAPWHTPSPFVEHDVFNDDHPTLTDVEQLAPTPLLQHYHSVFDRDDVVALYPHMTEGCNLQRIPDEKMKISPRVYEKKRLGIGFSFHQTKRLRRDAACPVVYSASGHYLHPEYNRSLTVRELARLMGLPDSWAVLGPVPISQLGKGVCLEVATWMGRLLAASLEGVKPERDDGSPWLRFDLDDPSLNWVPKKNRSMR